MCCRNRPLSRRLSLATALASLLAPLAGCLPGLRVTSLQAESGKPASVAVYMKVETNDGKPVPDLTAGQFTIFEDGARLPRAETKQAVLSPKLGAAHDTLLLIDVSGTTVGAKEAGDVIKAATAFTERVQKSQNVGVYSFDGGPDLTAIVPFASLAGAGERASAWKPKDPKASLDGAIVEALRTLASALAADPKSLKFGTLVVFTDGTNRGTLETAGELRAAMAEPENAKVDVFAVGIGDAVDSGRLSEIGRSGSVTELDASQVTRAFDAVAAKVVAASGRYYLLAYCTPARSGPHEARIEVHSREDSIGEVTYSFNADGFGDGCDPTKPPRFEAGLELARAGDAAEKKKEAKKPAKKPPAPAATPAPAPAPAPAAAAQDPFSP